ncbi:Galactoside Alpha-(1,2)-Fucosyltransferase 2 [Manis pentadactyla]|nr:Galactoside Alpha-(1,2)-Fucosyltransferase 2 [Manis pentadactyla]
MPGVTVVPEALGPQLGRCLCCDGDQPIQVQPPVLRQTQQLLSPTRLCGLVLIQDDSVYKEALGATCGVAAISYSDPQAAFRPLGKLKIIKKNQEVHLVPVRMICQNKV